MSDENPFSESFSSGINSPAEDQAEDAARAATGEAEAEESQLNIRIPKPLHDRFRRKCEAEGRSMTWVVLQAVRQYVREDG
jgi:predicted HicB family RNase H-like nuclease